ncbi:DUF6236 family protein [Streptomyces sp. NPDC048018]|uniref:DUF6236 family protein n=1 Tax=Streptomyces sp. NPDC048018 TaxID=3365499 RepID=UPI0037184718
MQQIGLYYPYIHCRDERWLKLTALYWAKLARVVPDGYPVADSETAAALNDGLDGKFLDVTSPRLAAGAVAPLFLELIREHGQVLRAIHGVMDVAEANGFQVTAEPAARPEHNPRFDLAGLHEDEIAPELRDALLENGLAIITQRTRIARTDGIHWIAMRPRLAWVYKCVLTDELARRTRFTPLTDQPTSHGAHGWDARLIAQTLLDLGEAAPPALGEDLQQAIGLMSLRLVVPEDLDAVPVEKIVRLRTDHRAEFTAFTDAVSTAASDFRESLGSIEDPEALRKHLTLTVARTFETPLEELRKAMRGLGITTAFSAMNTKFELGTATTLVLGSIPAGQPLAAAGGAVLGLAALRHSAGRARDAQLRASPAAFLLRAERDLQPRQLHTRVLRGFGRLTGTSV